MKKALTLTVILASMSLQASAVGLKFNQRAPQPGNPIKFQSLKCTEPSNSSRGKSEPVDATPGSSIGLEDTGTPGCHNWEMNVVVDADLANGGKGLEMPLLDISTGISDNIALTFSTPYAIVDNPQASSAAVGKSSAGAKWHFYHDENRDLDMAVMPNVEFNLTNNGVEQGVAEPGTVITLPIAIQKAIGETRYGDVMMVGNLGYSWVNGANVPPSISAGVGIGAPVSRTMSVMAGITSEKATQDNSDGVRPELVKLNIGFTKEFRKFKIYGSIGQSLRSNDGTTHRYFMLGISKEIEK